MCIFVSKVKLRMNSLRLLHHKIKAAYNTPEIVHNTYRPHKKLILQDACGTKNRHYGPQNVGQRNFETTSHNLIRLIKILNWIPLNYVM